MRPTREKADNALEVVDACGQFALWHEATLAAEVRALRQDLAKAQAEIAYFNTLANAVREAA